MKIIGQMTKEFFFPVYALLNAEGILHAKANALLYNRHLQVVLKLNLDMVW